ncbi:MAG TPA: cyclic di-AMP binding protein CbpA [Ureibacillus sp.]|nr:cyclic di-AMP binding protein CbpA [Ureibacillus sp.]
MIVKQRYLSKEDVVFCKESDLASDVLAKLKTSGYRCIPVLDESGKKFVGNAYKVHILEHQLEHDEDVAISELLTDKDGFISEGSSFYQVFFSIKRLPYLAVLDENGSFAGILTHSKIFEILEDAWGYKSGSCALTLAFPETDGILAKTLSEIKKKHPIQCVLSLDDKEWYLRRVIVTLSKGATNKTIKEIEPLLTKIGARIIDVEVFDIENF